MGEGEEAADKREELGSGLKAAGWVAAEGVTLGRGVSMLSGLHGEVAGEIAWWGYSPHPAALISWDRKCGQGGALPLPANTSGYHLPSPGWPWGTLGKRGQVRRRR